MFVANVAFGRFRRGAEIPRDEFTANELAQLELDGYIVDDNPVATPTFASPPMRRGRARKAPDAVLQPPAEQP